MTQMIENYDVLIGIDRRGVAKVLKHRTQRTQDVQAEVKLTTTTVHTETFSTQEQDTLGLLDAPPAGVTRSARVAVDSAGIKSLLLEATTSGQRVLISGTKVDGTRYEKRCVRPISISNGRYLYCEDVLSCSSRTFTLDNIDRVEFA